jgi:hypothetical protein
MKCRTAERQVCSCSFDLSSHLEILSFKEYHLLATCLLAGFAETISSALKMEAICSSEVSVETQLTTRRHIPEDDTLHNHRCENLKSSLF